MGKIKGTLLQQYCSNDKDWMSLGRKSVLQSGMWQQFTFHSI